MRANCEHYELLFYGVCCCVVNFLPVAGYFFRALNSGREDVDRRQCTDDVGSL